MKMHVLVKIVQFSLSRSNAVRNAISNFAIKEIIY